MNHRKKSNTQEKIVSKEIKGKQVIASGAFWTAKGDVRSEKFLVECKTTEKPFYSLTLNTWLKIRSEAIKDGLRIPVMCIDLENGKTRIAVFEAGMFGRVGDTSLRESRSGFLIDYSSPFEIDYFTKQGYKFPEMFKSIESKGKSVRIKNFEEKFLNICFFEQNVFLNAVLWKDFLNMIEEGEIE